MSAAAPTAGSKPFRAWSSWCASAGEEPSERLAEGIGREVAHLATLRRMSLSVAGMLQAGKTPAVEAAVVKDLGTNLEQALPDKVRLLAPQTRRLDARQQRRPLRAGAALHHPDRAQADDPRRHPRSAARHHRPRPRAAIETRCRRSDRPLFLSDPTASRSSALRPIRRSTLCAAG